MAASQPRSGDPFDYAVVGAGLAGAATAWRIAQRGHGVAILERSEPANSAGSSHGSARIFRYAYEDPFYTGLVQSAAAGWKELETAHGAPLIRPTGCLDFGEEHAPKRFAAGLEEAGVTRELLSKEEASARWPQFAFTTDVLWHPGAGVIDAEGAVHAMVAAAVAHSATLLTGWTVASVTKSGAAYALTSSDGRTLDARNVVIAAGGWLPGLLGNLDLPRAFLRSLPAFEVRQETAFHFPYRDQPAPETPWPTFIHKAGGMQVYGLPGGRDAGNRGQKVAEYNGGKVLPDAASQDGKIDPAHRRRMVDYVAHNLPGLVPEPYAETTCLFTNTPTEDFVIDRAEGITVLSPCSGHGAKFAPLLGALAADLASGAGTVPARFRPSTGRE
ncbi:FAD-dependent oxidoreductase [Arthrobacter sp. Sa2BUA2]|uniref:FAD-dependent oxidoreductase n=1 Tax=Arthrobacter pullicola TaxID=2762224 RepID=A0ABR8YGM2_9MICC|nr:FAD-dependent oxidoreductase [Arthrobacter pullicola]MBD8043353.1 FAD-dependent oxidoreductase [Arthrobacter pullicola]